MAIHDSTGLPHARADRRSGGAHPLLEMHRVVREGRAAVSAAASRCEVDAAIHRALGLVAEHSGVDRAYVFEYRDELRRLDNTHEWCAPGVEPQMEQLQDLDAEMVDDWTKAFLDGDSVVVRSVADYPDDRAELRQILLDQGIVSIVVHPLRAGGELIGFIGFDYVRCSRTPTVDDLEVLATLSDTIALSISRQHYAERLDHSEKYDHLTGLLRRRAVTELLDRRALERNGMGISTSADMLCVIDIDDFGGVNDRYGTAAGDALLREMARRIAASAHGDDLVARLGNDTFALLVTHTSDPAEAAAVVTRLSHRCRQPVQLDGRTVEASVSIGLAMARTCSDRDLLHRGEAALREAKASRSGRSGAVVTFEPELERRVEERIVLGDALCSADVSSSLWIQYQPVVDLVTRHIVGAEALARWDHPLTGAVTPDVFIPLAEQLGCISTLTRVVATQAVTDLRGRFAPAAGPAFQLSINLSTEHLVSADFLSSCEQVIGDGGVDPHRLWLEVTESVELADEPRVAEHLAALRSKGFRVAIDDFGTGYSSFARLRDLPVDGLKIDRSFVGTVDHDPVAAALVTAQVELAHTLGLVVVAEGVETDEQVAALLRLGVRYGQGYGLHRPMGATTLVELLAHQHTV